LHGATDSVGATGVSIKKAMGCFPTMNFFIDFRLFAISAGENIFSQCHLISGRIGATGEIWKARNSKN
jgi:hypothetical protein